MVMHCICHLLTQLRETSSTWCDRWILPINASYNFNVLIAVTVRLYRSIKVDWKLKMNKFSRPTLLIGEMPWRYLMTAQYKQDVLKLLWNPSRVPSHITYIMLYSRGVCVCQTSDTEQFSKAHSQHSSAPRLCPWQSSASGWVIPYPVQTITPLYKPCLCLPIT